MHPHNHSLNPFICFNFYRKKLYRILDPNLLRTKVSLAFCLSFKSLDVQFFTFYYFALLLSQNFAKQRQVYQLDSPHY